jgi:hypothetical protein
MRGAHATFAEEAGCTGDVVAAQLGHTNVAITHQSYTRRSAVSSARQQRVIEVLDLSGLGNGTLNSVPQGDGQEKGAPASDRNP